jgi:citrate lyase subunit beta-like protein
MAASILRRSLLYVPSSSMKFLEKSRGLTVDCVAYDLEDSVTATKKAEARKTLRQFLAESRAPGIREQAVRINSVDSGLALDDLNEVVQ